MYSWIKEMVSVLLCECLWDYSAGRDCCLDIALALEIFQLKLEETLSGLYAVKIIVDDFFI